jgi:excisionase family DNA binding protein
MTEQKEKTMGKLWTVKEAAEYWHVSQETIRRLIRDGKLSAISVGRSYRIPDRNIQNGVRSDA